MFSKKEKLLQRTPKNGVDRKQFINLLVEEFLHTKSFDAKQQVLANLVNFAYDPLNYEFLRESCAIDLFLNELDKPTHPTLTHFACSGIVNLCLDPLNADYIIKYNGFNLLANQLKSENPETVLEAIVSLIYLCDRMPKETAHKPELLELLENYKSIDSSDSRLKNLATIYLEGVSRAVYPSDINKLFSDGQIDTLDYVLSNDLK